MNLRQCGEILDRIRVLDNRRVDERVVAEWFTVIGDLDYHYAMEAVTLHRQTSTEWLMPAHLRAWVERLELAVHGATDEWGNEIEVDPRARASVGRLSMRFRAVES